MQTLGIIILLVEAVEASNASAQRTETAALACIIGSPATAEVLRAIRADLLRPAQVKAA